MKKNRIGFFLIFAGAGLLVSFGVCAMMYIQFESQIKSSYVDTLSHVALMIEKRFPELHDMEKLKQGYENDEDWFWESSRKLHDILDSFNLAYIYYIEKTGSDYVFRMAAVVSRDFHPEWIGSPVWTDSVMQPEVESAYNLKRITYTPHPYNDEWGSFVSLYLPVVSGGRTVGILGLDYDVSYVETQNRRLLFFLIVSFLASSLLILLLAYFGSRTVLSSIRDRERAAVEAEERRREIETLMKSLKNASVSRSAFLANVSTEMSNPIHSIIDVSSKMHDDKKLIEDQRKNLELITDSGIILLNVINDILDISKLEAGQMKVTPVKYETPELISEISAQYTMLIEHKPIHFVLNIDEKLPQKLYGDRFRLKQICANLLDNAYRHTAEGTITMNVSCKPEKGFVWLIIKVIDTGSGFSDEDLRRLFSDYDQIDIVAKYHQGGVGLGLNIARRIAKLMKGTVAATSEPGKGSVFTLTLPQKIVSAGQLGPETAKKLKSFQYSAKA